MDKTIKEALRLSEEAIEYARQGGKIGSGIYGKALAAIRSAKKPQITTPDVCGEVCARAKLCYGCNKDLEEANAKYAEQAEQEPFQVGFLIDGIVHIDDDYKTGVWPLYAAPVRTKDLTDDEIWDALTSIGFGTSCYEDARAAITADREKNK